MIDVALLGRTPRFDDDDGDDETMVECFRRFVQNESSRAEDGATAWDEPLEMICDRGV